MDANPTEEPDWLRDITQTFSNAVSRVHNLAGAVRTSLQEAEATPRLVQVLDSMSMSTTTTEEAALRLSQATKNAEIAQEEADRNYGTLGAMTVVFYWAALETFVGDLVLGSLTFDRSTLDNERLSRIKLPASEFLRLDESSRLEWLVREAERGLGAELKAGVGRFESVLSLVGLHGDTRDATSRGIYELQKIRNLVAHRAGRVDVQFAQACPGLGCDIGSELVVDAQKSFELVRVTLDYGLTIHARAVRRFGGNALPGWENTLRDPWEAAPDSG